MSTALYGQRLCRAAFAAGVVIIVVLSLLSQDSLPSVQVSDKVNHVLAYGCVTLAGGLGFRSMRQWLWLALGMTLLGIAMEALQGLLPSRHLSLLDIYANSLGIILGLALAAPLRRILERRGL